MAVINLDSFAIDASIEITEPEAVLYKDNILEQYYLRDDSEGFLEYGTGNRYTLSTSLAITNETNMFDTVEDLGIPYTRWSDPVNCFEFLDINRTVLFAEGDSTHSLRVFDGDTLITTVSLTDEVRGAVTEGNILYLLLSDKLIKYDVSNTISSALNMDGEVYQTLYTLPAGYFYYDFRLHHYDDILYFAIWNASDGRKHLSMYDLQNSQYTSSNISFAADPRWSASYEDFHAVLFSDGNITIIDSSNDQTLDYDLWSLYDAYSGTTWDYSSYSTKIVCLPEFNLTHGELLLSLPMYYEDASGIEYESSDLVVLNVSDGSLSSPSKYGFDERRYPYYTGLASNPNASQILFSIPTSSGSELKLLHFDENRDWQLIGKISPENYFGYQDSLQITPYGFIAESDLSGIIIHNFYEMVDISPPDLSNILHTDNPDQFMAIEIRVDVIDDFSTNPAVSLGYTYDGYNLVNGSMTPLGNGTYTYTIPAINDDNVTSLEYQISASDDSGNFVNSQVYIITFDETTSSDTTSDTSTTQGENTTSTGDTTEGDGFLGDEMFSIVLITSSVMMLSVIVRRKKNRFLY